MSGQKFTCFSDAILKMDCISCVRCILNTTAGLQHFISSDVYTKKLTMTLSCCDFLPKKQVIEMLSTICVYSNIGYLRVMEGLHHVKNECDELNRFSVIVRDLQGHDTVAYKTAIITFINALINCTPEVSERIRIRNEFIGLQLLEMISQLRKEGPDEDLLLQLEVFHERKMADEEGMSTTNNIDFNSPQDLLDQIQARVFGSTRMVNFVNILQDLLAIETVYSCHSGKLWQTVDDLVHHTVHSTDAGGMARLTSGGVSKLTNGLQPLPDQLDHGLQAKCGVTSQNAKCSVTSQCAPENRFGSTHGADPSKDRCGEQLSNKQKCNEATPTNVLSCEGLDDDISSSSSQNRTVTNENWTVKEPSLVNALSDGSLKPALPRMCSISPTDLTFFSSQTTKGKNSFRTCLNVEANNCSKTSSDTSVNIQNTFSNRTIVSQGDGSIGEACSNSQKSQQCLISNKLQMNINVPECKGHVYPDSKVSIKIYNLLHEQSSLAEDITEDMKSLESCLGSGAVSQLGEFRGRKQSNAVVRSLGPAPKEPLHPLKWVTLSDERIAGREPCVWSPPITDLGKITVDYSALDSAFQVASPGSSDAVEEIVLLDTVTRLKINLFLSRMDAGAEDLVAKLEIGDQTGDLKDHNKDPNGLSLPMLQYLGNILPCQEEVEMLRCYKGPRLELGMAEQFVLLLSDIPDYMTLLEGQLMRREFTKSTQKFHEDLTSMINLAKLLLESADLKQILNYVLRVGNYLNYGRYHGDAAGFKLCTLLRLGEVRGGTGAHTLLHHTLQACKGSNILGFVKEVLALERVAKISMETMKGDINKVNLRLRGFMANLVNTSQKLQNTFQPFIESLKTEFGSIQSLTTELRALTDQLANYFCEDETAFNILDCFKTIIDFCKQVHKCQNEGYTLPQVTDRQPSADVLKKRLRSKLIALEFGQNAGASSSMVEEKPPKVTEKILHQLHKGNFQPCVAPSTTPTPEGHPLEMSCIPFVGSPAGNRVRCGTNASDNVFVDTPELVCAGYNSSTVGKLTRSSTQKLRPVTTTCTAQTMKVVPPDLAFPPSPITGNTGHAGKKSETLHRKLFPAPIKEYQEREVISEEEKTRQTMKSRRQLELPKRNPGHRRSRSDMLDSFYAVEKWIEYEKNRDLETIVSKNGRPPLAEPESICNLSTLNLEKHGKFISNKDVYAYQSQQGRGPVCSLEQGPTLKMPEDKNRKPDKPEKKSSVGGFFSKLGRAVLKPRNVYSDGDQYLDQGNKVPKERKKSFSSDKENVNMDPMPADGLGNFGLRDSKRSFKSEGNANKVSRFFQRGGLYRSSKAKKKNQNVALMNLVNN
ncbi:hypothetical protein DPMN_106491 [Dreissena polymorpha]|uniref:Inverted formin-2 n=2 Tax=Dreissena polymorpha TaxID=45954 RepID=A0A9D4QIK2_DREPO|nr:hypothetical protein DPMN_106491 [Dreissena polymorpha]